MAHMEKYARGATSNLLNHYERSADNYSNESINIEKSYLNYNLAVHQQLDQHEFVKKRLSEVKVLNRENINVMCDWLVTAPKDVEPREIEQFFQETYNFIVDRYDCKDNVISAYVHLDEVSPHMHFSFIPIVPNKKGKYKEKVSAKELITRQDLKTFHNDLSKHITLKLGREVEILNEATKEGNKSIAELKRKSATERLKEVEEKSKEIITNANQVAENLLVKAKHQVDQVKLDLLPIQTEYESKKSFIDEMDRLSNVSMMYPEEVKKETRGIVKKQDVVIVPRDMWEAKHISANEKQYLEELQSKLEQEIKKFKQTSSYEHIKGLENENVRLSSENQNLKRQVRGLKKDNRELNSLINVFKIVIGTLIELITDLFKSNELSKPGKEKTLNILDFLVDEDILTKNEVNDMLDKEVYQPEQEKIIDDDYEMSM